MLIGGIVMDIEKIVEIRALLPTFVLQNKLTPQIIGDE
jgi:hypothetical protein